MNKKSIGQKILYFPLTKIIIGIIVVAGVFGISKNLNGGVFQTDLLTKDVINLIITIISTILSVVAYIYLYKFYEKRKITEFSKKGIIKIISNILKNETKTYYPFTDFFYWM